MKPYGRVKIVKGGKPWKKGTNPGKGYVNWWENMCDFITRSRIKQMWKNDLKKEN